MSEINQPSSRAAHDSLAFAVARNAVVRIPKRAVPRRAEPLFHRRELRGNHTVVPCVFLPQIHEIGHPTRRHVTFRSCVSEAFEKDVQGKVARNRRRVREKLERFQGKRRENLVDEKNNFLSFRAFPA